VVVEVGQAVAAGALQRGAVEHADAAAAEHVEQRQRDQQAEQDEEAEAVAEGGDAGLQRVARAVLGEQHAPPEQAHRRDVGVALVADRLALDRLAGARGLAQQRVGADDADLAGDRRGQHAAVDVEHRHVLGVGPLRDRGEHLGDLAERPLVAVVLRRRGAPLERARVGGVHGGVLADEVGLDAVADDEVLERPDRAEREDQRQQQSGDDAFAQAERARVQAAVREHPGLHRHGTPPSLSGADP
jgi:hypothetical protein